jgi:4-hydroxy-tetrahydrodipicolinate synthase
MTAKLRGVFTALPTLFDAEERVDVPAVLRMVDRSISAGVDGVAVGGSTGEFASLDERERRHLVEAVVEHADRRVPVIAQTGAMTTAEAIRHSREAQRAGADVLMLAAPYYEPLTLEETLSYLREVAGSVELPVMLYNAPGATGVNLEPDVVAALARQVENIEYVKDSSADWEQALRLIHHHGDAVDTFVGWDAFLHSALVEGAAGVMAGTVNVVPEEAVALGRAIREGRFEEARRQWGRLYPVIDTMISEPFVAAVKAGLGVRGEEAGHMRKPATPLSAAARERIEAALRSLG